MKSSKKALTVLTFLIIPTFFIQGCGKISDTSGGAANATTPAAAGGDIAFSEQSAEQIVNLAFKYADLKTRSPLDFQAALSIGNGCAVAAEYIAAIGQRDLSQDVIYYCEYLNTNANRNSRDCNRALSIGLQILSTSQSLNEDCTYPSNGESSRSLATRARTLVDQSINFAKTLGLDFANSRRDGRGRRY